MGNCCGADGDGANHDVSRSGPEQVGSAPTTIMPTPQPDDNIQKYTNDVVAQLVKSLGEFDPG